MFQKIQIFQIFHSGDFCCIFMLFRQFPTFIVTNVALLLDAFTIIVLVHNYTPCDGIHIANHVYQLELTKEKSKYFSEIDGILQQ